MSNAIKHKLTFDYIHDPKLIEGESFRQIRELTDLDHLSIEAQQVVMRVVHSVGIPSIATQVMLSKGACQSGIEALKKGAAILCDVEMVKQGITKRMIKTDPLCFLNAAGRDCIRARASLALPFLELASFVLEDSCLHSISHRTPPLQLLGPQGNTGHFTNKGVV